MIEVREGAISPQEIMERVSREGCGSVVVHLGVVKPEAEGRKTKGMRLLPVGDLAGELGKVETELRAKWPISDVVIVRRVGEFRVGEVIMAVAVSAATKDAAFGACEEAVRSLKLRKGLRKEELFDKGGN